MTLAMPGPKIGGFSSSERVRVPSVIDKFAATLNTVFNGTAGSISPAAYKLGYDYNLSKAMDGVYDNALRYRKRNPLEFLDGFIAQITPGIVSNIMTGGQQGLLPGILTKDVKKNRLLDYFDALDHNTDTLQGVFGPLQAP